ncbi:FecR domain-containing protein [Planctomycetota bacterium]
MTTPEHAGLFDAYLRDDLSPEEKAELTELLQNKDGKQEFAEYVQMSGLLVRAASRLEAESADKAIEAASRTMPSIKALRGPRQARGRRRRSILRPLSILAAAACIALAAGYIFLYQSVPGEDPVSVAHIIETSPDNTVTREGLSLRAAADMRLFPEDRLNTSSGDAWIRYPGEGIAIEVMANTELTFAGHDLVRLKRGQLACSVDGEKLTGSFHVKTPHGIVDVLGTRFLLEVILPSDGGHGETCLEVIEGAVKLTRNDGAAITVGAGQFAVAAPDKDLIAAALEKAAGTVNLIEGDTLEAAGWRHDTRSEGVTSFVKGFSLSRGMLVKGQTTERVRLIKEIAFDEGEISFTYQMNKGYWSFMIRDDIISGNFYEVGFETELNGRHTVRLIVDRAVVRLFVDNKELIQEAGFKIEGRLTRALQTPVILRLHVADQTTLTISDMTIKPKL